MIARSQPEYVSLPVRLPYRPPVVVRPPVNIPIPVHSAGGSGGPIRPVGVTEAGNNAGSVVAPVAAPVTIATGSGSSGFSSGCSGCDQRAAAAASFISANWLWFAVGGVVVLVLVMK